LERRPEILGRINKDLLILTAVVLGVNLPFLLDVNIPLGDTSHVFRSFYFFYNEVFFHHRLPLWAPLGTYGTQSDVYFLITLSPASFLAILTGLVFKINNALLVFKIDYMLEELILLYSMYLLSNELFRNRITVLLVCLSAIAGLVAEVQIFLNLRAYYLMPLIIYFMVLFFRDMKPSRLISAMVVFLLFFNGNTPYLITTPLLALTVIGLVMTICYRKDFRRIIDIDKGEILLSATLLLLLAAMLVGYYYFVANSTYFLDSSFPKRDPRSYKVSLDTFLSYGMRIGFDKFKGLVYPFEIAEKTPVAMAETLYTGVIPLIFAIYGLFRARTVMTYALLSAMAALGLLSLGEKTFVAALLYRYFPLMDYFRHIGSVVNCYKIFIPLLAGFGLDAFLSTVRGGGKAGRLTAAAAYVVLISSVLVGSTFILHLILKLDPHFPGYIIRYCFLAAVSIFILFIAAVRLFRLRGHVSLLITVCLAVEILVYQGAVGLVHLPVMSKYYKASDAAANVSKLPFIDKRDDGKPYLSGGKWEFFGVQRYEQHAFDYNYLQFDPCVPLFRVDVLAPGVIRLLNEKFNKDDAADDGFLTAIGCNAPKLQLKSEIKTADSIKEALDIVTGGHDIGTVPVVYGLSKHQKTYLSWYPPESVSGTIVVTEYSTDYISMDVTINSNRSALLYYSEAWHPSWEAYVNGKPVQIILANLAFKSLFLDKGQSRVEFVFENKTSMFLQYSMAIIGVLFTASLMVFVWVMPSRR
jgi:hypothetical protein